MDHIIEVGGPGTLSRSVKASRVGGWIHNIGFLGGLVSASITQHSCRDIVDTVPYSGMALNSDLLIKVSYTAPVLAFAVVHITFLSQALLGGINRRLDRQKA